jgi:hypothetical protein
VRRSRTSRRNLAAIAAIGTLAVAGSALAASNTVPQTNAGQGDEVVEGFSVSDISYTSSIEDEPADGGRQPTVIQVEFDIVRDDTGDPNQSTAVADANAEVFVQLRTDDPGGVGDTAWYECDVTAGAATCDTSASPIEIEDVVGISVVAYDIF